MNIFEETKNIMRKYNIKANKSLGQNFLINSEVVEKIIESSEISDKDMVIEIGPGLGTLTKYLLEKARKVLCVELDSKMIRILQDRFSKYENFELINADILKVDLNEIICENKRTGKIQDVKVVANLPYYITTPIIMKLLEEKLDIQSITVMIQKEVADRMKKLLSEYNNQEEKTLEDILNFHVKFECIHPFQDGNGRVGRLIMFKECLKYNIVPFIIEDNLKMFYYRGLKEWDNEKGYLTDTCLTAQDRYKAYLDYFRIAY